MGVTAWPPRSSDVCYVAIGGTWSWRGGVPDPSAWWVGTSSFARFLESHGLVHAAPASPFVWSSDLDGVPGWKFWRRPASLDWESAGYHLVDYCAGRCRGSIRLITHSHGLQVALWAAALGLRIAALVDVSGPVRGDMLEPDRRFPDGVARAAKANIGRWVHVHSDASDRTQVLGGLFDGVVGIVRAHPLADINAGVPRMGHSRLLNDASTFDTWRDQGWISILREPAAPGFEGLP